MQKGDRHRSLTGNIWAYAHRGDMTGVKAALVRGVDVNLPNTVGWTACHAAAAGGHTKVLRALHRCGADLALADRGGDLPVHAAAKHGHAHALQVLAELGADITRVRLSQTCGKAARALVAEATRKKQKAAGGGGGDAGVNDAPGPVGYARKQAKSTAFFGPRKTPISGKIKRAIQKERRRRRRDEQGSAADPTKSVSDAEAESGGDSGAETGNAQLLSYAATVQQVKKARRQQLRARAGARQRNQRTGGEGTDSEATDSGSDGSAAAETSRGGDSDAGNGDGSESESEQRGTFAALAGSDSDSSDSDSESNERLLYKIIPAS
jgi:ankyrin repeat protein